MAFVPFLSRRVGKADGQRAAQKNARGKATYRGEIKQSFAVFG
jgi:hypothetical protein